MSDRTLPADLQAEKAVLGCILVNNDLLATVASVLSPADFFRSAHSRLYKEMVRLFDKRAPIDLLTLSDVLRAGGALDECGGPAYIGSLTDGIPRSSNIEAYAQIVTGKSRLRQLIGHANEMLVAAYDGASDAEDIVGKAGEMVFALGQRRGVGELSPMSSIVPQAYALIELHANKDSPIVGLATGFDELDKLTSGFRPGDLVIAAARPGMGKTSLVLNIAHHVVESTHLPVAIFSLEMTKPQLCLRQLAMVAEVSGSRMLRGTLSEVEYQRLSSAIETVSSQPIHVDDHMGSTLFDIRAKCRALKSSSGLALVVVDYIQLLLPHVDKNKGQINREREVAEISRGLKALAKELDVPVIGLSQLSRANEARRDKRPVLSDLRESGALEQDADVVLFIHRAEEYKATEENRGMAELIIAKSRNGPTGSVELLWHGEQTRFANKKSAPLDF